MHHNDVNERRENSEAVERERREHQIAGVGDRYHIHYVFAREVLLLRVVVVLEVTGVAVEVNKHQRNGKEGNGAEIRAEVLREHILHHLLCGACVHRLGIAGRTAEYQLLHGKTRNADSRFKDDV